MRAAQHAEKVLRSTDIGDEDAADGMTQMIDEVTKKHDNIRHEMGQLGVTVPISHTAGLSEALTTGAGTGAGRRMQFERQIVDIKEACVQLKEMMEYEDNVEGYDNIEDAATSVSGGRGGGAAFKDIDSGTTMSQILENEDSDDDDSKAVMTPRGVYVQRCLYVPLRCSHIVHRFPVFPSGQVHSRATLLALWKQIATWQQPLRSPSGPHGNLRNSANSPIVRRAPRAGVRQFQSCYSILIYVLSVCAPVPIQAPLPIITVQQTTNLSDVLCIAHQSIPHVYCSSAVVWAQQSAVSQ